MGLLDIFKRKRRAYHHVIEVSDETFREQVIQRSYKTPILVDFWASWCVPCRQFSPLLERIATEPDSGFMLAMLNTEGNRRTASRFNIRSIPAVKVFRNGQIVGEFVGGRLEHQVRQFMSDIIAAQAPTPHLQVADSPRTRLKQAKGLLRRGKGFEAAIFLRNFPDTPEAAQAHKLLPLAQFLWDLNDGDGWTGNNDLDDLYASTADFLDQKDPRKALHQLKKGASTGNAEDQHYTAGLILGIEQLLIPTKE